MKSTQLIIELLEDRIAPANIVAVVSGHTLKITGTSGANEVEINADPNDDTIFSVSSSTDTINGGMDFFTPSGVTNISVKMLGGDDSVRIDKAGGPTHVLGNVSVDAGDGANTIAITDLSVDGDLSVVNGTEVAGSQIMTLTNLNVGGNMTVTNKAGNTELKILRDVAGNSVIGKNLTINNGRGYDTMVLSDTNVGGNVTVNDGPSDAGSNAGQASIYNHYNSSARSVIKGNLAIVCPSGSLSSSSIWDTVIQGNVTVDVRTSWAAMSFDGNAVAAPVEIDGSLTVKSAKSLIFSAGAAGKKTGLTVGGAMKLTGGADGDSLTLFNAHVGGPTQITNGKGENTLTVDDSTFIGAFTDTDAKGSDTVKIETTSGTSAPTVFEQAVFIDVSTGPVAVTVAGADDAGEYVDGYSTFLVHKLPGATTLTSTPSHEFFPFNAGPWLG